IPEEPPLTLAERALLAADSGEWAIAADLYASAISREPTQGDLRADYAMTLLKLDRLADAERAFDEASHYLVSGEAERWAALCAIWRGASHRAPGYLARALARCSSFERLATIEGEPDFAAALSNP